jgi:2'-5' RNA ligase
VARLFFAVWPEAAAARELARVAESLAGLAGGKPMPAEKIHMTLAFLGSIGEEEAGSAVLAAARLRAGKIAMAVEEVGSFRRARVGWAAPSRPVPALIDLQSRLDGSLRDRGFALDARPYAPHATLVRKIARPIPRAPIEAIEWRSESFTLVVSTGGRYEVLERWGLK